MSRLLNFFRRAPNRPLTTAEFLVDAGITAVAVYSSFALIAHHVVAAANSEGPSMYPTMSSTLSYTIYLRRHRHGRNIQVGDVVVFENPVFLRERAIKRVIGMPGDYVVRDPAQSPTVGGAPVVPTTDIMTAAAREEPTMVQVPEGHVWLAGDNLSYSRDSRFYGPLPMALIQGKCIYNGDGWFNWTSLKGEAHLQPVLEPNQTSFEPVSAQAVLQGAKPD
ncbi:Mitochondrial inner membrane peptidase complex subunit [Exophiala xenobiotica]|nr:Mitochondrial inner membrane peptidase complex subunit [Exophiala xenobiotica]KAK5216440.1 Mitochondrial inner membrane peptidase complex subunit [Exophiala xenobiotica]KAK5288990.1 Mitochondrial inner membrane peptidase complex subunit [Exophiala xenobiotica]KAK5422437.1 Mitochondrial inner membrane peptidase complex subunit [Exophiala xenobiotica]KAK5473727.1 Mitochondrial inner membrane peptidase complex subunit [Exophiala xenobiotica]